MVVGDGGGDGAGGAGGGGGSCGGGRGGFKHRAIAVILCVSL